MLSPLFLASAILSYKLAQQIQKEEKAKKREERRKKNIQKVKSQKADWGDIPEMFFSLI